MKRYIRQRLVLDALMLLPAKRGMGLYPALSLQKTYAEPARRLWRLNWAEAVDAMTLDLVVSVATFE